MSEIPKVEGIKRVLASHICPSGANYKVRSLVHNTTGRGGVSRYRLQWEKLRNNRLATRSFECNAIFPVDVQENIPKGNEVRSKENQVRVH